MTKAVGIFFGALLGVAAVALPSAWFGWLALNVAVAMVASTPVAMIIGWKIGLNDCDKIKQRLIQNADFEANSDAWDRLK